MMIRALLLLPVLIAIAVVLALFCARDNAVDNDSRAEA